MNDSYFAGKSGHPLPSGGDPSEYQRGEDDGRMTRINTGAGAAAPKRSSPTLNPGTGDGLGQLLMWIFFGIAFIFTFLSGLFLHLISKTGWIKKPGSFTYSVKTALYATVLFIVCAFIAPFIVATLFKLDTYAVVNSGTSLSFLKSNWFVYTLLAIPPLLIPPLLIRGRSQYGLTGWKGYFKALLLMLIAIIPGLICTLFLFTAVKFIYLRDFVATAII